MEIRASREAEKQGQLEMPPQAVGDLASSPTAGRAYLAGSIISLALLGYWLFPGHLYLFHDTLIYIPMLEHLWDPTVLRTDFLATRPHLFFTIYHYTAFALRQITGLGFREVLMFQQITFRAVGILGVYLIGRALKLSDRMALVVAAIFSLGATTVGSALASFEFEPVPRSFALPLILFALGLTAHERYLAAGIAASIAFLYHPPIGYPFWLVYSLLTFWPSKRFTTVKRLSALPPLACAVALLLVLSQRQLGLSGPEPFFCRLDPFQEQLQRLFAPYLWVSIWPFRWVENHLFLLLAAGIAFWRIRKAVDYDLRYFLVGLPLVGILSMPANYVLIEKLRWRFMPQFQPMRALVYLAIVAGITTTAAGIKAVELGHYLEGFLWLAIAFAIPTEARVLHILAPRISSLAIPLIRQRVLVVLLLALSLSFAIGLETRRQRLFSLAAVPTPPLQKGRWASLTLSASVLLPFFLLPFYARVNRFAPRDSPELHQLANWAQTSTPKDATFLFPDAGTDPAPTVFRASALRPVYIDWMSNIHHFSREFNKEWWSRWQTITAAPFDPQKTNRYTGFGVDYIVIRPGNRVRHAAPVFENSRFLVYRLSQNQ
jgi:hypothetical protein